MINVGMAHYKNIAQMAEAWKKKGRFKEAFCPYCNGKVPDEVMAQVIKECKRRGVTIVKVICDKHNMEFIK